MSEVQDQVHCYHYQKYKHQPFEVFMERSSHEQKVGALNFNITKYILRWQDKNGLEDLQKARWYLNELITYLESVNAV